MIHAVSSRGKGHFDEKERKKVAEIEPKCLILNCYHLILFSGNFSHLHYSELGGECIGTL